MQLSDIIHTILYSIINPIVVAFSKVFEDFYDAQDFFTPMPIYLFSEQPFLNLTPNEYLFISLSIIILIFLLRWFFSFIKWLFKIPGKLVGKR